MSSPLRIVFFGSGAFGLPTLKRLLDKHEVVLVVTQPDRPAGRNRVLTPTPISQFAVDHAIPMIKPLEPNVAEIVSDVHAVSADAFVVIAYGHKLSPELIGERFAINLHASLLPKFRGAAPINWAMMRNEHETGVSVINLAQRMDAGAVFAQVSTPIDPLETAGELHDRLAELGVEPVLQTLRNFQQSTLAPLEQIEEQASRAPKLSKDDGTVTFDQAAADARARVHGLTPWPGCTVRLGEQMVKLLRVREVERSFDGEPGTVDEQGVVACRSGAIQILELQPPGKRAMTWQDYTRGHKLPDKARFENTLR